MAGSENSTTILEANNQQVAAINDLSVDLAAAIADNLAGVLTDAIVAAVSALPQPKITVVSSTSGGCSTNCVPGGADLIDSDPSEGQTEIGGGPGGYDPPASWGGTTEQYDTYKCQAATWIADNYIAYVDSFTSLAGMYSLMSASTFWGLTIAPDWVAILSPVFALVLFAFLITNLGGLAGLAGYLATYSSNLTSTRDDFICELYNSPSVDAARAAITAWVGDNLPAALGSISGIVDYHVSNLFPNNVINTLFEEYTPINEVTGSNCSSCSTAPPLLKIGVIQCSQPITYGVHEGGHRDTNNYYDQGECQVSSAPIWVNCDSGWIIQSILVDVVTLTENYKITSITYPTNVTICYWVDSNNQEHSSYTQAEWPTVGSIIKSIQFQNVSNQAEGTLSMTWIAP